MTTLDYLLKKYGLALTAAQVAEFWGITIECLYSKISDRSFPVPSISERKDRRWDARDVARVWDERREEAQRKFNKEQMKVSGDRRFSAHA